MTGGGDRLFRYDISCLKKRQVEQGQVTHVALGGVNVECAIPPHSVKGAPPRVGESWSNLLSNRWEPSKHYYVLLPTCSLFPTSRRRHTVVEHSCVSITLRSLIWKPKWVPPTKT